MPHGAFSVSTTFDQLEKIVNLLISSEYTFAEIGNFVNRTESQIKQINNGAIWSRVTNANINKPLRTRIYFRKSLNDVPFIFKIHRGEYIVEQKELNYTADSIKSLEGIQSIRLRPTIFMGELGTHGVYRMFIEAFANVVDEFNAGRGNVMKVTVNTSLSTITVEDNCSGIPIEKLEDIITKPFTGGKYDKKSYAISVGLNGCGLKICCAMSDMFIVDVWRDGKHAHGEFSKGVTLKINVENSKIQGTGTTITFRPDVTALREYRMDYEKYRKTLEMCAYMNPGFRIDFKFDDKLHKYYYPQGIIRYFEDRMISGNNINTLTKPIVLTGLADIHNPIEPGSPIHIEYDVYFSWSQDVRSEFVESYVNGLSTPEHGTHVTGFRNGINDAIRKFIQKYDLLPKNSLYGIESSDIKETCISLVVVRHSSPLYSTQIKESLTNDDIQLLMKSDISTKFTEWLELNQSKGKDIYNLINMSAKARYAAAEAKSAVRLASNVTNQVLSGMKKLTMCKSNNPEECELFIVEGDSAGGSAKVARDSDYQAIYSLMGKPLNIYKETDIDRIIKNPGPIGEIVKICGCGYGSNFDISKLRFHKIIFMADADPDGKHILSLLIGFFFTCLRPLIENGHVYLANPPLYEFSFGKNKNVYFKTMEEYWDAVEGAVLSNFQLCATNGKQLFPINEYWFAKQFMREIRGYSTLLEETGRQVNVNPKLLESIITQWDYVTGVHTGGTVDIYGECVDFGVLSGQDSPFQIIDCVYDNTYHRIELNEFFVKTCKKLISQLASIKWRNLLFYHAPSNSVVGPGIYRMTSTIEKMINTKAKITRYKGLGESDPDKLKKTTMSPSGRLLTRVTCDPVKEQEYRRELDIFIGNDISGRKSYYRKTL